MSDKVLETVKLDDRDRKTLIRLARKLNQPRSNILRWAIRYYALYAPIYPAGDSFPGETLDLYGVIVIGPKGLEVRR